MDTRREKKDNKLEEKEEEDGVKSNVRASSCDVEALKKCLEEHKGDYLKCQSHIEAFKSSCSLKNSPSSRLGA